jgi:hypothetical protein
MTEETTDKIQSMDETMVIDGQIRALTGLVTHLLCLSTIQVAIDRGDPNFVRVAKETEEMALEQTASLTEGDAPGVKAAAIKFQKEILKTVRQQMRKDVQILHGAAMNGNRRD